MTNKHLNQKDLIKQTTSTRTTNIYKTQFDILTIKEVIIREKEFQYSYELSIKLPKKKKLLISTNPEINLSVDNYQLATDLFIKYNYYCGKYNGCIYKSIISNNYLPHTIKVGNKEITLTDNADIEDFLNQPLQYIKKLTLLKVGLIIADGLKIINIRTYYVETSLPIDKLPILKFSNEEFTLTLDCVFYDIKDNTARAQYKLKKL